ncbi:MAG: hypothetical protein EOP91_16265, partial [Lysobacteraceae bacterium]
RTEVGIVVAGAGTFAGHVRFHQALERFGGLDGAGDLRALDVVVVGRQGDRGEDRDHRDGQHGEENQGDHAAGQAAEPLKRLVEAHVSRERTCPGNDDADFSAPEDYAAGNLASVSFGPFESELCGMELILAVPGKAPLDGKAVWLEYDPSDSSWQCSSEIDDKYLPAHCRG